MWLSRQQKRPNGEDGGRTGTVTSAEGQMAVRLDSVRFCIFIIL